MADFFVGNNRLVLDGKALTIFRHVGADNHIDDAKQIARSASVDIGNTSVIVGTIERMSVQHAGERQIIRVASATSHMPKTL